MFWAALPSTARKVGDRPFLVIAFMSCLIYAFVVDLVLLFIITRI